MRIEAPAPVFQASAATAGGQPAAGLVAAVHGVVIDVDFPAGGLPPITHALVVQRPASPLVVEVHAHLSETTVRCISLASVSGVRRGLPVLAMGGPVSVAVGDATLGRALNVLGEPVDGGRAVVSAERRSIYGSPPAFTEQESPAGTTSHRRPRVRRNDDDGSVYGPRDST